MHSADKSEPEIHKTRQEANWTWPQQHENWSEAHKYGLEVFGTCRRLVQRPKRNR